MLGFLSRFVDSNDRELKRIQPFVDEAIELEAEIKALSDEDIQARFLGLRDEFRETVVEEEPSDDELHHPDLERRRELAKARRKRNIAQIQDALDDILPDVFAMTREAMVRTLAMRHFDVQLIGGVVLHEGKISEMRTGEGKTLVAPLAAILNAIAGKGVHIVTVNDYLARRDPQWMGPIYHFLGLTVGMILGQQSDGGAASYVFEPGYPTNDERLINLRPVSRREAYAADVTYGTNNEFGFDYLRDNMVTELDQRVQRERYFAIVDEVDNILIDEARTPLIISGQAEESGRPVLHVREAHAPPARAPGGLARGRRGRGRLLHRPQGPRGLADRGRASTRSRSSSASTTCTTPTRATPAISSSRSAPTRCTSATATTSSRTARSSSSTSSPGGRCPGRRWSEGLHQAIEAKEGLRVQRESVTMATITFQNYFRLYDKLAGMTGTAMTEAEEFHKIYQLEVVAIPTHQPMIREDETDLVYLNENAKFNAVIDEIEELQEEGRPVLVGTVSVEKSEKLGELLKRRGIKHEVLNAKFHEKESGIVAQAGKTGAVTIATNMAGRGTDILLGGNPAGLASDLLHKRGLNPAEVDEETYAEALAEAKLITDEDHERVVEAGGLHIIGTERHDSRRIDNQLRGRAGRQGDPGSSRFYLSLDDDLMKRFASERVTSMMERLGLDEENYIESGIVGKTIESAQSRVEGFNFDIRKRVVEFDDVINRQRETIYAERDKVLRNEDLTDTIRVFLDEDLDEVVERHVGEAVTAESVADLVVELNRMGIGADHVKPEELLELRSASEIADHLKELADRMLEAKEQEVGPEAWATIERFVLLRTIDSLWVEHLTEVDDMRRGIGLRGYAQQDPLNEFRKEAFRLYEELSGFIRHQVASTIFRVNIQTQPHVHTQDGVFPMAGPGTAGARRRSGRASVGARVARPRARASAPRRARASPAPQGSHPSARPLLPAGSARASRRDRAIPRAGRRSAATTRAGAVPA